MLRWFKKLFSRTDENEEFIRKALINKRRTLISEKVAEKVRKHRPCYQCGGNMSVVLEYCIPVLVTEEIDDRPVTSTKQLDTVSLLCKNCGSLDLFYLPTLME